jgi:cytochrome c peroxidase
MFLVRLFFLNVIFCISSCHTKKSNIEATKIQLGKKLFYDQQLSYNQTKSCSSCHDPKFAFTDSYKRSFGIYGDLHQRNSKPLFNLQGQKYLTATDSTIHLLEEQMNNPMFNQHPPELGINGHEAEIIQRFKNNKIYYDLFKKVFPNAKNLITFQQIKNAIAAFVITIESYNSKYDKYIAGNKTVFNSHELEGMQLFFSDSLNCSKCHGGKNFDAPFFKNEIGETEFYFNSGIYNIDGVGGYPINDIGLMQKTKAKKDMGKFKVPTLRNLSFTAPYYHDGSSASLKSVIEDYSNGGRIIENGENKGNGTNNPFQHGAIKKLKLTTLQTMQLINFLETLNDTSLLKNPKYIN